MLTRNDSIILGQQVDVNKALDLLKMFQEAGKEKIDVWTILDESAPKIKSFATLEAKLEQLAGNHETCNVSEFSNWMKVSRSTVYTWRDNFIAEIRSIFQRPCASGRPFPGWNQSSIVLVLAPVAGHGIQQDEPGINLVLVEFESKLLRIPGNHDGHHACSTVTFSQVIPELAQMPALSRRCELDFGQQPVPGSLRPAAQLHPGGDYQASIHFHTITQRHRKRRELVESHRRRLVLVPKRRKSVIRRYEQVLAGDVGLMVEGRTVGLHHLRQLVPDQLRPVRNLPPGSQGTPVNIQGRCLFCRTRVPAMRALPVVALPVPVIEGHLTHGIVGVSNQD